MKTIEITFVNMHGATQVKVLELKNIMDQDDVILLQRDLLSYINISCYNDMTQIENSLEQISILFSLQVETNDMGKLVKPVGFPTIPWSPWKGEDGCEQGANSWNFEKQCVCNLAQGWSSHLFALPTTG